MNILILVKVLFATVLVNALEIPFLRYGKLGTGLSNQQVLDSSPINLLAEQRYISGDLKESHLPEVISVWEEMEKVMGTEKLKEKIKLYNDYSVNKNELHNKLKSGRMGVESTFRKESPFEVFTSSRFENHSLRIKKTHPEALGLDSVNQYTGYLDVNELGKHFFYWFFESRNDPLNDPIILWLNGGPGCSSATGLFFELGPSLINATLQPVYNPYSWNSNASIIFLDQPVGVGYSYTEGEEVKSTASAAKDVYIFLELFFQKFPQLLKNKFHIAGESYAGHYIPSFASEIISNADRSFDLSSVLIGNGITDSLIQYGYYRPMACGEGGYKPIITEEKCQQMDKDFRKCEALIKLCYHAPNAFTCIPSTVYCEKKMMEPFEETGLNVYDIRMKCEDQGGNCYKEMDYLDEYLNLEYVKEAVGAENIDIFTSCDDKVFNNFILSGDEMKPFQQYVSELLEKGIPVLLYAGDKDFICNWLGNHAWSDALDYFQHDEFANAPLKPWITKDQKIAGEVKNYGIFTFLRVYDAGHMVPFDQPENSLDMVNRWIQGDYSFNS